MHARSQHTVDSQGGCNRARDAGEAMRGPTFQSQCQVALGSTFGITSKKASLEMPKASKHHVTRNSSYGTEPATLLPLGLAPVHTTIDLFWTYLYFRFVAERHRMYERRQEGISRNELSQDETMTKTYLGNVYRQLDPGSISLRDQVIMVGDMSNQEVCCEFLKLLGDVTTLSRAVQDAGRAEQD